MSALWEFRRAIEAFDAELAENDAKHNHIWPHQSTLFHLDHLAAHVAKARTLLLNAHVGADVALIREEILHAQSRAIMSAEVFLRAQEPTP